MCEQNENTYLDGDVVWVKLGGCWWPGEVVGSEKLPPDVLPSFKKPPIAVVKFFQEDTYEYVKNLNSIYKYNCDRKDEFINKGLDMYRTKHGHMDKFPEDVIRAETAIGGDPEILTRDEFQEVKKPSYAGLFGDPKKTPGSIRKGKSSKSQPSIDSPVQKLREKSNYKVHILVQGTKSPRQSTESAPSPSTSRAGSEPLESPSQREEKPQTAARPAVISTPTSSTPGNYACHACNFHTTRLNILILHNKTHSATFTPYTIPTPVKKKAPAKSPKITSNITTTPKIRKPKQEKEKTEKTNKKQAQKRGATESSNIEETKKSKTDEEIKSSLLADWDDGDEESNDESLTVMAGSPEVPIASESPAVPSPAEVPVAQVPDDLTTLSKVKEPPPSVSDKPDTSNDAKYEFCEDEDWPVEADVGRKIPRVKNPSKRKDEAKSLSIDEDEMAREVAELLSKTTLPELPTAPETFKEEENFPEPSIVKSPDKQANKVQNVATEKNSSTDAPPTKTIFKTKTFFRSRHSRSQDAIGKYVAEQLNAAERMDMSESEINGSESVPLSEPRISPPVEHIKVARLAPKIQLKKMKAEAEKLLEREKQSMQKIKEQTIEEILDASKCLDKSLEKNKLHNNENKSNQNDSSLDNLSVPLTSNQEKEESSKGKNDLDGDKSDKHNKLTTTTVSEELTMSTEPREKILERDEPYMSESTASAVDALLSVSRETDRVTKIISDDPPEDLFEDDNKDNRVFNSFNGVSNDEHKENSVIESQIEATSVKNSKITVTDHTTDISEENIPKNTTDVQTVETQENTPTLSVVETLPSEGTFNSESHNHNESNHLLSESTPSESDLQVAEALINLPTTNAIHSKVTIESHNNASKPPEVKYTLINSILEQTDKKEKENHNNIIDESSSGTAMETISDNNDALASRFETEQEKSENLNAAQSLVQMSESIDHNINISDVNILKDKEVIDTNSKCLEENGMTSASAIIENNIALTASEVTTLEVPQGKNVPNDTSTSKLLKILEEPCTPQATNTKKIVKHVIVPGNEKILNFEVGKQQIKSKATKQNIIIRRATPTKNLLNNISEKSLSNKIILSPSTNKPTQDGSSSVQTYTIQATPDAASESNTIVFQQKIRKIAKPVTKLQKIKPQTSLIASTVKVKNTKETLGTETIFDINSMPVVLSDDILTPESIEKMPIVMTDANILTSSNNPPKLLKSKQAVINNDKLPIIAASNKPEVKTILMNAISEPTKVTSTPNILSKSSKLRGTKPMLVIDKTGTKKIIVTKTEQPVKDVKQTTLLQPATQTAPKTEKFIILPTPNSPRPPVRTQKIVIDPQTRKAHVLVGKGTETPTNVADSKPVSAKIISSASDTSTPGNTVMIITNAQGAQSRIVLTSEHEKILFPNKQQQNVSQLKQIVHRITPNNGASQKAPVSTPVPIQSKTRIVQKQKNTIITSKGQLIVGGRIATTSQNIAPLPEIRSAPKRIIATEPKKLVQAIQKNATEPLIFLQQKNGAVMQLTVAQFEHLQRTGQILQSVPSQEKIVVQKAIAISPSETQSGPKQRVRKQTTETTTPAKKVKHEIAIAPAPITPMPTLAPLTSTVMTTVGPSGASSSNYSELDNFEELLPSTAIARQQETAVQPELVSHLAQPQPTPVADGQLLAIPGEHFGGPQGSFYLCVEDNGTLTPIDNRPLILENNQLVPMPDPLPVLVSQPERRDILEAALANSDVFHAEPTRDDAPDFRDLNANVSVHCRVSETNTTLNQPIMTPVEVPSKADSEPAVPSNLEDGLAVIGVTPHTVPTSLELPITVTDPRIAPKNTDPLSNNNYGTTLLPLPNTQMTYVTTDETQVSVVGPISMPLLTDEESIGKSMPILTDEVADRTVSSIESAVGSPSSVDVRESETEDGAHWPRRLLTPCSDTSEASTEIPLQPVMQLSATDLSPDS